MTTATYRNYSGTAAALYDTFFVPSIARPVSHRLLETAALEPGDRVLDVACGTGVIARAAARLVGPTGTVTGVDVAPDMLAVARQTPIEGATIEWHEGDATALPVDDATYDVVCCQLSLMFLEDRAAALREMHRALAPGGRIVVNTPGHIQPMFEAMERAIVENLNPDLGGFVRAVFSMHDHTALASLLTDAGFGDVTSCQYSAPLSLPTAAEFLWNYINITPMGGLVAQAPEAAQDAMERQFVETWTPTEADGTNRIDQPMALASGVRS